MTTECIASKLEFQELEGRRVEAEFNGGQITSDSGGLLLREVESRYGFISGLAACFGDRRDPRFTEFSVEELVGQRIYGLALASISTAVQMTPFRFEPPARILDRRDLRLLCFHLR